MNSARPLIFLSDVFQRWYYFLKNEENEEEPNEAELIENLEEAVKRLRKQNEEMGKRQNITVDIAHDLWIAREMLSVPPQEAAKKHGTNVPRFTWSQYCEDIGVEKVVGRESSKRST